ncbi:MAG: hypothetical protein IT373_13435 [Polyangiaceae bacterium]|nr:hypothetical protein [Polyangiaceae bacterium]
MHIVARAWLSAAWLGLCACASGADSSGDDPTPAGGGAAGAGGAGATGGTVGTGGEAAAGGGGAATGGTGGEAAAGGGGAGADGGAGGAAGQGGAGPACGNDVVEPPEACDGAGATCSDLGFVGGAAPCTVACTFDLGACSGCHNGVIDVALGEDCDFDAQNDPLVATTCQALGYPLSGANPGCTPDCQYDIRICACGNGALDAGEPCDGAAFDGHSCVTEGFGSGTIACTPDCTLDTSGCSPCGNGQIDPPEPCDGADLGAHSCLSDGFGGGTLACLPGCVLDTSGCDPCGNGVIDPGEACDGSTLGGQTCVTAGFGSGVLGCHADCTLDTSGCDPCGNGVLDPGETCDDGNLVSGDGCSSTCKTESASCDPDGTYLVVGPPIAYSCCFGLVSVNVSSFVFASNGATIASSPSNPVPMTGAATTCPAGSFDNAGSIPGGCAETYHLVGSFTGPDSWTGTYQLQFSGPDCSCFGGLDTPCVNQLYTVTATR